MIILISTPLALHGALSTYPTDASQIVCFDINSKGSQALEYIIILLELCQLLISPGIE